MDTQGLWRGLYAGVGPTVLKGGVNNCIRFSAFNEMKYLYQEYKGASLSYLALSLPVSQDQMRLKSPVRLPRPLLPPPPVSCVRINQQ